MSGSIQLNCFVGSASSNPARAGTQITVSISEFVKFIPTPIGNLPVTNPVATGGPFSFDTGSIELMISSLDSTKKYYIDATVGNPGGNGWVGNWNDATTCIIFEAQMIGVLDNETVLLDMDGELVPFTPLKTPFEIAKIKIKHKH
jgi:hypothetical protein